MEDIKEGSTTLCENKSVMSIKHITLNVMQLRHEVHQYVSSSSDENVTTNILTVTHSI